jgi:hypothetical protein
MQWIKHYGMQQLVSTDGFFLGAVIKERPPYSHTYYSWHVNQGGQLKRGGMDRSMVVAKKALRDHLKQYCTPENQND